MNRTDDSRLRVVIYCLVAGVAALVLLVQPAYGATCLTHWSLNNSGGLSDACSGLYGLTNNGAATGTSAVFNEGYTNAAGTYLNSSDLNMLTDWTICLWFNTTSPVGNEGLVSKYNGVDTETNYLISTVVSNSTVRLFTADGFNTYFIYTNTTITEDVWYHVCVYHNSSSAMAGFWLNNSHAGDGAAGGTLWNSGNNAEIGRISAGVGASFVGVIDDIWFFSSILSDSEVSNLFNYGNLSGPPVAPASVGCSVYREWPVGPSDTTSSNTPTVDGNLTCYQDMADNCSLLFNGTVVGTTSTLTNGSSFSITAGWNDIGYYNWTLSCTNGSVTNLSTSAYLDFRTCGNLSVANTRHELVGSIDATGTCFNVSANNVTIDCGSVAHNTINFAGGSDGYGVYSYVNTPSNVTVEYCEFDRLTAGTGQAIYLRGGENYTLFDVNINVPFTTGSRGIYVYGLTAGDGADNVNISNVSSLSHDSNQLYYLNAPVLNDNSFSVSDEYAIALSLYRVNNATSFARNSFSASIGQGLDLSTSENNMVNDSMVQGIYWAVYLADSSNNSFNNVSLSGWNASGYGVYFAGSASNNTVVNSSFASALGNNSRSGSSGANRFLNVSFAAPYNDFANAAGNLSVMYYLFSSVYNCSNGTGMTGVNVSAFDVSGSRQFSALTTAGVLARQVLTEYVFNSSGRAWLTNYTVRFNYTGFHNESLSLNLTTNSNSSTCLLTDWAPVVVLNSPLDGIVVGCWTEPCVVDFVYTPIDEYGFIGAELWTNGSGAWALNMTNSSSLVNDTTNTFSSSLYYGTYVWNVNVTDGGSGLSAMAPANFTVTVGPVSFGPCGVNGTVVLNFTFWDEENATSQLNGSMEAVFYVSNSTSFLFNASYNNSWLNVRNVSLCLSPWNGTFYVSSFQTYHGTGYRVRDYFLVNASVNGSLGVSETRLYLIENGTSDLLTVTVQQNGINQEDVYVKLQRYYPEEDLYREVEIERTDVNGNALLYIHPFDVWYRFVLNWDGHSTVTPPGRISASEMTLETSDAAYSTYVYLNQGVVVNCSENVSAQTIACVVDDASGLGSNYRFTARELNVRGTVVCSQSLPGASSVTFTCNATNASNSVEYSVSVESGDGWFVLKNDVMELPFSPPLGMVGLLAAWVLITGFAFIGLPNGPSGAALFALAGLIFAVLAQFMVAPEVVVVFFAVIVGLAVVKSRT